MKINYSEILKKNMINVFKDVLKDIETNGLQENHHLYITFDPSIKKISLPKWLKEKHPREMTIVIQYEYWDFRVNKNSFNITLSFNSIKTDLEIPFNSVLSFADPYANFGLRLIQNMNNDVRKSTKNKNIINKNKKNLNTKEKNNIIDFKKFKKI